MKRIKVQLQAGRRPNQWHLTDANGEPVFLSDEAGRPAELGTWEPDGCNRFDSEGEAVNARRIAVQAVAAGRYTTVHAGDSPAWLVFGGAA